MTRIRAKRATPRRRKAPLEDAAWWEEATALLLARAGHRCERCGQPLAGNLERHHRQRRAVGGDRLCNLMALHTRCHAWITEHPEAATANGWIVSSYAPDPAEVAVYLPGLSGSAWWLLRDDGTKTPQP